jgi:SAM-dependent methyltransferase
LSDEQLDFARRFIARFPWREASTFRDSFPHSYLHRFRMHPNDHHLFNRFYDLITPFGVPQNFMKWARPYLIIDNYKYWRMVRDRVGTEPIINRATPPELVYTKQTVSETYRPGCPSVWDWESNTWTEREPPWVLPAEEEIVREKLRHEITWGSVLNVGCGHGRLLDIMDIRPSLYAGIDPSQGMLNVHVEEHRFHRVYPVTLAEFETHWANQGSYDNVLALFGTADFLTAAEIELIDKMAAEYVLLMFHGEVEPLETRLPEALDAAQGLGLTEFRVGRWLCFERSGRLF